jgi:hypothetical protein
MRTEKSVRTVYPPQAGLSPPQPKRRRASFGASVRGHDAQANPEGLVTPGAFFWFVFFGEEENEQQPEPRRNNRSPVVPLWK